MKNLPLVLTMGEPAGVGPELTIKVKKFFKKTYPFYVIGDYGLLSAIAKANSLKTKKIKHFSQTFEELDKLCILDSPLDEKVTPGKISIKNSSLIRRQIEQAVSLIKQNQASALVTNPINKFAIKKSSCFYFEGHTDFLASLDAPKKQSVMMLTNRNNFRVVPTTIHIPLKQVSKNLTPKLVETTVRTVYESLKNDYETKIPKILVTGLNPHAGEGTTIGFEEKDIINPVIDKLKKEGFRIVGPTSADTAFSESNRRYFDAFVCMYHDQALIPIKTLSFDESVNVTLGLSFVRTSPDHGTALDIAGKNIASPNSLILAIKEAQRIVKIRKKNEYK